MATNNGKKVRSVDEYIQLLKLAGRSDYTTRNYREALNSYARFLNVPVDEVHEHLSVNNLMAYAASIKDRSDNSRRVMLAVLRRYMELNGVEFDELELNVTKIRGDSGRDDKPLELTTLQKMMDLGNPHSRALLSFMVSTGCRAGETSKIVLSDLKGDTVTIRNEIAKGRRGGKVFLTTEAREFLDLWLRERDEYIRKANQSVSKLYTARTHHAKVPRKDNGTPVGRPEDDQRLFACSYTTIDKIFGKLYRAVDGEKGKYRAKVTAHACRAYFRTHAAKTMGIDLVEGILRHTGYLNAAYVRMTDDDRRKAFHAGESALYITRADHRIQQGELDELRRENAALQAQMEKIITSITAITKVDIRTLAPATGVKG